MTIRYDGFNDEINRTSNENKIYEEMKQACPEFEQVFDSRKLVPYVASNETVDKIGLTECLRDRNNSYDRWLIKFVMPIDREVFIRRLPIFCFYSRDIDIEELFFSYQNIHLSKNYVPDTVEARFNMYRYRSISDYLDDNEELFEKLEYVIYNLGIKLEEALGYLMHQFGNINYINFNHWIDYCRMKNIELREYIQRTDYFPTDLKFEYNVILENRNQKAILYPPKRLNIMSSNATDDSIFLEVKGDFPVDRQGNVVTKWVSIWLENASIVNAVSRKYNFRDYERAYIRERRISNYDTIIIAVNTESRVFFGRYFTESSVLWTQVYCGAQKLEYDWSPISEYRKKKGISIASMSSCLGISDRTYQRIEEGTSTPDALTLFKIMNILNIKDHNVFIKDVKIRDYDLECYLSQMPPSEWINKQE